MQPFLFSLFLLFALAHCQFASSPDAARMEQNTATTMSLSPSLLQVTSTAFDPMDLIPVQYTCDGADINPPLHIEGIPLEAKCLALIVDDPDAPRRGGWVHWVVWDIPLNGVIDENSVPGKQGLNDFGKHDWGGPCPPSGTHRYFFKVYALDVVPDLPPSSRRENLERAMAGHVLAQGELVGRYQRR